MIATDRDAWRCDLAETYGILDYQGLPVETLAALSVGLRDNSRIKMQLSGEKHSLEVMLLMAVVDQLRMLTWMQSKDGAKGRNRPKSLLAEAARDSTPKQQLVAYDTGEDFMKARSMWLKEAEQGDGD